MGKRRRCTHDKLIDNLPQLATEITEGQVELPFVAEETGTGSTVELQTPNGDPGVIIRNQTSGQRWDIAVNDSDGKFRITDNTDGNAAAILIDPDTQVVRSSGGVLVGDTVASNVALVDLTDTGINVMRTLEYQTNSTTGSAAMAGEFTAIGFGSTWKNKNDAIVQRYNIDYQYKDSRFDPGRLVVRGVRGNFAFAGRPKADTESMAQDRLVNAMAIVENDVMIGTSCDHFGDAVVVGDSSVPFRVAHVKRTITAFTLTKGSPTIVNATGHGLSNGALVELQDNSSYRMNSKVNTVYVVTVIDTDSFSIPLNTSGSAIVANDGIIREFEYVMDIEDDRIVCNAPLALDTFSVANLPTGAPYTAGTMAYCTDETGGPVPVFYDGTNWRRVTDRSIAS